MAMIADNQIDFASRLSSNHSNYFQLLNANSGNISIQNFLLNDINIATPIIIIMNNGFNLSMQLNNASILNINQLVKQLPEDSSGNYISKVKGSGGVILLRDNGVSDISNSLAISIVNCRFENVKFNDKGGVINAISQAIYNISIVNTTFP